MMKMVVPILPKVVSGAILPYPTVGQGDHCKEIAVQPAPAFDKPKEGRSDPDQAPETFQQGQGCVASRRLLGLQCRNISHHLIPQFGRLRSADHMPPPDQKGRHAGDAHLARLLIAGLCLGQIGCRSQKLADHVRVHFGRRANLRQRLCRANVVALFEVGTKQHD